MSAPSRAAQELLDKLAELARLIESHEVVLWQLKHAQMTLRSALAQSGYQSGYRPQPQDELL